MFILGLLLGVYVIGFVLSLSGMFYYRYKDKLSFYTYGIKKDIEMSIGWPYIVYLIWRLR